MGTISRQTTWSTGDTLTASDINGEFDNILSTANGSLNADNLGVTAGQAAASKAIVLDSNKDFADTSSSNQIRNLTISGSLKIGTTFLPDASGGADLGSTALEWGDVYIADDKKIYLGSDQDISLQYDETTNNALEIAAAVEGAALGIVLKSDQGDDAGDEWKLNIADGGTLTLGNDIASAGTYVTHLTLTPNSTVSSSTLALAGALTVAGTASITGVATVGGITIGSAVINEAELETIDGITAGTVAASKAVVVDSNKDAASFRNITLTGELDAATLDISGNADIDGTTNLDAVDIDGAVQIDATVTVGADDQGYDVQFFGDTASAYLLWDTSADKLLTAGGAVIDIVKDKLLIGGTAVTTTAAELNVLDAVTAGTVAASKGVVVDANKDIGSFRNVTLTGELDAATGDFSGDVDVDGTLEADAITLNGTALGSLYSPIAGSSSIVTVGTIGTGTWQGTAVASAYLDADTAHLSTTQTFSGAKTFSAAAQFSNTVTVGENGTGYDVQLFGDTAGSSVLWDQSADDLILTNAGLAVGSDATGDLYYRNSSGYLARLGVGSDGQVLTSTGTLPNWEAAAGGGHTIQEEGSSLTQRTNLNFVGAGVTATDDSGNNATKVTVTPTGASLPVTRSDGSTSDPIALTSAALGESLVSDTTPQLGGNLDVNGQSIVSASNGNINIAPNGSGVVQVGGTALLANDTNNRVTTATGSGTLNGEANLIFDGTTLVNTGQGIGVGEAPSTWHSGFDFVQIGGTLALASQPGVQASQAAYIVQNAHYDSDGSWEYQATDEAHRIGMSSGNITFDNAASDTAGNDITWKERLRIDASGNLRIVSIANGVGRLNFADPDDTDVGRVQYDHSSNSMEFYANAAERMRLTSAGNLGIGMDTPSHKIDVTGTAGLSTGTAWTNTSDARIKKDVETITGATAKIRQLRPVSYKYTDQYLSVHPEIDGSKTYHSFVADEYESVFPNAVSVQGDLVKVTPAVEGRDEVRETLLTNLKQFTPHDLQMFLTAAIQELDARITALEAA